MRTNIFTTQVNEMFKSINALPKWVINKLTITAQMRLIREALGMTQSQLADRVHVPQSAIAKLENKDGVDVRLSTIKKIAAALNCKLIVSLVPNEEIMTTLDKKSLEKAQKLVSISTSNSAVELESPDKRVVDLQVEEMQKQILERHKKTLWDSK